MSFAHNVTPLPFYSVKALYRDFKIVKKNKEQTLIIVLVCFVEFCTIKRIDKITKK